MNEAAGIRQMHQSSGRDDRDNTRPQRHLVVDHKNIGAPPLGENAAVVQVSGAGRRRRDQAPRFRQGQHAISDKTKRRQQLRRIVIVGRQHRAEAFGDHVGRPGPSGMAAAAHDIGGAKHDEVAG